MSYRTIIEWINNQLKSMVDFVANSFAWWTHTRLHLNKFCFDSALLFLNEFDEVPNLWVFWAQRSSKCIVLRFDIVVCSVVFTRFFIYALFCFMVHFCLCLCFSLFIIACAYHDSQHNEISTLLLTKTHAFDFLTKFTKFVFYSMFVVFTKFCLIIDLNIRCYRIS